MTATILVVDDDIDYLEQARIMLEFGGYTVITAESVKQAEQILGRTRPDAAILDLMLEEADGGFRLCRRIKQIDSSIPVMIVTRVASETGMDFGAATPEERAWVKADALLSKPVRFEQLQRELLRLLKQPVPQ